MPKSAARPLDTPYIPQYQIVHLYRQTLVQNARSSDIGENTKHEKEALRVILPDSVVPRPLAALVLARIETALLLAAAAATLLGRLEERVDAEGIGRVPLERDRPDRPPTSESAQAILTKEVESSETHPSRTSLVSAPSNPRPDPATPNPNRSFRIAFSTSPWSTSYPSSSTFRPRGL